MSRIFTTGDLAQCSLADLHALLRRTQLDAARLEPGTAGHAAACANIIAIRRAIAARRSGPRP